MTKRAGVKLLEPESGIVKVCQIKNVLGRKKEKGKIKEIGLLEVKLVKLVKQGNIKW